MNMSLGWDDSMSPFHHFSLFLPFHLLQIDSFIQPTAQATSPHCLPPAFSSQPCPYRTQAWDIND